MSSPSCSPSRHQQRREAAEDWGHKSNSQGLVASPSPSTVAMEQSPIAIEAVSAASPSELVIRGKTAVVGAVEDVLYGSVSGAIFFLSSRARA